MNLCVLTYLVPNLSVYSGQQGSTFAHQPCQKRDPLVLPILARIATTGSLILSATALGVGHQQYLQRGTQIADDFTAVQGALDTLQDQVDSLAEVVPKHRVLDPLTANSEVLA